MEKIEFAIRELSVALNYLIDVVDNDPYGYEALPDSFHHALVDMMREIENVDWEVLGR